MRFIIFSDSHGANALMNKAINLNIGAGLDGIIFLGDWLTGAKETAAEHGLTLYAVAGNCDFNVNVTNKHTYEQLLEFDGKRILICHGHRYHVKSGTDVAERYAQSHLADVLMYGHTHTRDERYIPPSDEYPHAMYVFNPGSISLPDNGIYSFGLMEIKDGNILLSHGEVKGGLSR
ncbi:MAG: YfcE family phosphodiesterase [Clostridiales bacterium]|nr:YfcE family phosphodiesterase [Clostridiales bacterium]